MIDNKVIVLRALQYDYLALGSENSGSCGRNFNNS
jgi:hypothetical protein